VYRVRRPAALHSGYPIGVYRAAKLSILWVFAVLNYLYGDVIALFDPANSNNGMTPGIFLGVAILVEISIAMTVMSRVLKLTANRWANIVAGTIETAAVVLGTILFPILNGRPTPLCSLFFGTIEVACASLIVWYAWRWPRETAQPN
jgi:hypothetical protein